MGQFADWADEARRAGRNWNQSTRAEYRPSLENIPSLVGRQRSAGISGREVLEDRYRFAYCFYNEKGDLLRESWVTEQARVSLATTSRQLKAQSVDREGLVPLPIRNARYRQQEGEIKVERCGFIVDSIVRMVDA